MGSGYFCPVCKMEIENIHNHIDCPGPNRNSGPFPGRVMGGRGQCSKCGEIVNNVSYHESVCGNIEAHSRNERTEDLGESFFFDNKRVEELEAENKKLRDALRIANEKLSSCNRRLNRAMDDSFNDIMPDRDDYR